MYEHVSNDEMINILIHKHVNMIIYMLNNDLIHIWVMFIVYLSFLMLIVIKCALMTFLYTNMNKHVLNDEMINILIHKHVHVVSYMLNNNLNHI
jgi:hypothetical protein